MRAATVVATGATGVHAAAWATPGKLHMIAEYSSASDCTAGTTKLPSKVLNLMTGATNGECSGAFPTGKSIKPEGDCSTGTFVADNGNDQCSNGDVDNTGVHLKTDGTCSALVDGNGDYAQGSTAGTALKYLATCSDKHAHTRLGVMLFFNSGTNDCIVGDYTMASNRVFLVRDEAGKAADNPSQKHASFANANTPIACFNDNTNAQTYAVTKCVPGEEIEEMVFDSEANCQDGTKTGTKIGATNTGYPAEAKLGGIKAGDCVKKPKNGADETEVTAGIVVLCPAASNAVRGTAAATFAAAAAWLLF